uniref:Phosphodiesterase n=1 Tax=Mesocestoides corti TaxID=53468 RepID=A0A5K3F6F8_MESCO
MPKLCGCTGDSTTCMRRWPWSKKASAGRRSTTIGESVDDSELATSPSIAKPEMDESFTARTSGQVETPKSIRPPVTFDLDGQPRCRLESLATQPSTDAYVAMRNHSLDIEVGSISPRYMEANCDANRTFPNFFNSKPTRASTRLYPTHTAVVIRRGSQLVRAGRPLPLSSLTSQQSAESSKIVSSTTPSATVPSPSVNESHSGKEKFLDETFIVTPFAQILAGLRSVQTNIGWLTDHHTSKSGSEHGAFWKTGDKDTPSPVSAENYDLLAAATKKELEWCLQQLENIQTKRPVSDMAYTKFKRLLSQKLGNFTSTDKTRNQISEYISKTFMDEYSEQENNDGGSSNALAGGSEGLSTSRTDVTGFSLESSVDEAESRTSRRHSRPDRQASASLTTTKSSSITDPTSSVTTPNTTVCESKSGQLPYLGITTSNDAAVRKELEESLDTWGLNMFSLDALSDQHSLTVVAYRIFSNRGLFSSFNIDPATFVTYILRLESSYQISNPYHNHIHGADVLQAVHVLLQAETLDGVFSDIEILTTLFASAIHDVHHPGVTNQFLVNTDTVTRHGVRMGIKCTWNIDLCVG